MPDGWHEDTPARAEAETARTARNIVVLLDGTLSSLEPGHETNIGLIFKLLSEVARPDRPEIFYEEGIQWGDWRGVIDVVVGKGINRQIRRAYGFVAQNYQPGDRIFLIGYSRGAYAVRSLAGAIDRIGLLRPRFAKEAMVLQMYRDYRGESRARHAEVFSRKFCDPEARIEMVGVFDTVKALGLRLPLLWRITEARHRFHSHHLGHRVRHGYQALALNETREVFAPILWECPEGWRGHVEQVWFRGNHADIGGQLAGFEAARPLSNIPLVWMLEKMEACGMVLPEGWRARFPRDAEAPSSGGWRGGWSKVIPLRRRRVVGRDPSESLHPTARGARRKLEGMPLSDEDAARPAG